MAYSRKLLTVGAMGVAALALIGTGASATFTDQVKGSQTVKTGVLNMTVQNGDATASGKVIRWTTGVEPVGSTFTTGEHRITVKNEGTIPATKVTLSQTVLGTGSNAARNGALYRGVYVKINTFGAVPALDAYTGKLSGLPETTYVVAERIETGDSFSADVTYFAGTDGTPSLENGAQGAAINATWKIAFEG